MVKFGKSWSHLGEVRFSKPWLQNKFKVAGVCLRDQMDAHVWRVLYYFLKQLLNL